MYRKIFYTLMILGLLTSLLLASSLAACSPKTTPTSDPATDGARTGEKIGMANPASVFCQENGGKLEMRTDASGGQVGMCIFNDSSSCEEWAYFRGECKPGGAEGAATKEVTLVETGWTVYEDTTFGFRFEYPADATISSTGDDPAKNVTITGPLANDEYWPVISIDHPADQAEFRPPEGADLGQWLADKFMIIPEQRQPDAQIAGTLAIHTRFEGSKQAYADDKYFFVHCGQLYKIVIGHTGRKEDWNLYNHFLDSFQFTK
jgi:putative hemolysin